MYKTISWKTGPNRGQPKEVNQKKIKKFHDAWTKKNGYSPQAPKRVGPPKKNKAASLTGCKL